MDLVDKHVFDFLILLILVEWGVKTVVCTVRDPLCVFFFSFLCTTPLGCFASTFHN